MRTRRGSAPRIRSRTICSAVSSVTGSSVSWKLARRRCTAPSSSRPLSVKRSERNESTVSKHYGVNRGDLLSGRRNRSIVRPRQIGMYLAKLLTSRSLPEIGRRFGNRDHTTVLHAIRKIEQLMNDDNQLREEIELLKRLLRD